MKSLKLFLPCVALLFFILTGCSKINKESSIPKVPDEAARIYACETGDIGYPQLFEGEMHNKLVNLLIENWSICSNNANEVASEIKRILKNDGNSIITANSMDFNEFKSIVDSTDLAFFISTFEPENFNFEQHVDNIGLSPGLSLRLKELVSLMERVDYSLGVENIQTAICEYYEQNKNGLNQNDLVYFGAATDVAMFSTQLWLDNNLGGEGKYFEFQNIISNMCGESTQERGFSWWKGIILADAIGLVTAATISVINSGGATAVPNPLFGGLPSASVVRLVGGVAASVTKAL